jgi:hypothetical protein
MQKTISAIVISVMPATLGEKSAARNHRGTTPRLACLHECGVAKQFPMDDDLMIHISAGGRFRRNWATVCGRSMHAAGYATTG